MNAPETAENTPFALTIADGIAQIAFDRPRKLNAFNQAMWQEFPALLAQVSANDTVRVLVLSGRGGNFCAGADIGEFEIVRRDAETARSYESLNAQAFAALRVMSIPTIAAISGVCFGGGFGLAAACDLRIGTPDAQFAVPAGRLGLAYPQDAMQDIVAAAGTQMAKYLTFTGARIEAKAALACGFLLEVVPQEALASRVSALAATIAQNAPLSVRASKAAIRATLSGENDDIVRAIQFGNATFDSADYAEGRAAFRERRKPRFTGQ